MKEIAFFCSLLILISCNKIENTEKINDDLQGDWISDNYAFSFYNSLCDYLYPELGEFTKFYLSGDTIICKPKATDKKQYDRVIFNIINLEADTLELAFDYLEHKNDTIRFLRCRNKLGYEVVIDSIMLSSSSGLTLFPSMNIFIDNKMNFYYEGFYNVQKKGKYFSEMDSSHAATLLQKFRNVEHTLINDGPEYGCFGSSISLRLCLRNKKTNYRKVYDLDSYNRMDNPTELLIFVNYLMHLYKELDLNRIDDLPIKF
ncbi:hypothetical protein ACFLTH_03575 [Bacteroidota bacterium]